MRERRHLTQYRRVASADAPLRVGLDVTPLLGRPTGIARFTRALVDAFTDPSDPTTRIELVPFAMTARHRRQAAPRQRLPIPARPMRVLWERSELAPITWWTGPLDLVHGTNYVVPPAPCGRLVSVHDLTAIRFPEMCTSDVRRLPVLLQRLIDSGGHVHTDSRFVAEEVVELLGAERSHVHTIPLAIPADPAALTMAARRPHPYGGRPYLLALGTVEPRKSYPMLVSAFQEVALTHPDLQLVIAGGDGWGADLLARALARLAPEIAARVRRENAPDDARRDVLLAHAHAFVYPSRYEGFGFPPLEAMLAGRPVVATDAGSLPEVLGDAAMLVPHDDEPALVEALGRVVHDDGLRADLVARGTARVALYDWRTTARGFYDLYHAMHEGRA